MIQIGLSSSNGGDFGEDSIKLLDHVRVADGNSQFSAISVILSRTFWQFHVLFFDSHIIVYHHLHIHSVVFLLFHSFFFFLWRIGLIDLSNFSLNHLHNFPSLRNFINGLLMLLHFAQNRCLIQIGLNNLIFLTSFLIFKQIFLNLDSIRNCSDGQSEFLLFFVNTSQVVES